MSAREWPRRQSAVEAERTILIVECDRDLGRELARELTADGYLLGLAASIQHARALARAQEPALALIGNAGSAHGAQRLLGEIRSGAALWAGAERRGGRGASNERWRPQLPSIVIGPDASELSLLRAFEAGADDFVAKPVRYLELRARIGALLRRCTLSALEAGRLQVGALGIDFAARAVHVHGRPVQLRRLEYELLRRLAQEPERVWCAQELLRLVWGDRGPSGTRTLDSHASRLRCKLLAAGGDGLVINVRGVGYRLI